jgi:hypothetical protein
VTEMEQVLTRLAELEQRQRDQGEILAATGEHADKLDQVSELVADLEVKVTALEDIEEDRKGRMPRPTPQWHALTKEELDAELHKLNGYVTEIFPLLGHMVKLGDCWRKHPLACMVMDVLGELYQCLFMGERRPPKLLNAQADYLIRVLPGLLRLLERETSQCREHSDSPYRLAGTR